MGAITPIGHSVQELFKAQLEVMESPTFGYVTPDMYQGQKLDL